MNYKNERIKIINLKTEFPTKNSPLKRKISLINRIKTLTQDSTIKDDIVEEQMGKFLSEITTALLSNNIKTFQDIFAIIEVLKHFLNQYLSTNQNLLNDFFNSLYQVLADKDNKDCLIQPSKDTFNFILYLEINFCEIYDKNFIKFVAKYFENTNLNIFLYLIYYISIQLNDKDFFKLENEKNKILKNFIIKKLESVNISDIKNCLEKSKWYKESLLNLGCVSTETMSAIEKETVPFHNDFLFYFKKYEKRNIESNTQEIMYKCLQKKEKLLEFFEKYLNSQIESVVGGKEKTFKIEENLKMRLEDETVLPQIEMLRISDNLITLLLSIRNLQIENILFSIFIKLGKIECFATILARSISFLPFFEPIKEKMFSVLESKNFLSKNIAIKYLSEFYMLNCINLNELLKTYEYLSDSGNIVLVLDSLKRINKFIFACREEESKLIFEKIQNIKNYSSGYQKAVINDGLADIFSKNYSVQTNINEFIIFIFNEINFEQIVSLFGISFGKNKNNNQRRNEKRFKDLKTELNKTKNNYKNDLSEVKDLKSELNKTKNNCKNELKDLKDLKSELNKTKNELSELKDLKSELNITKNNSKNNCKNELSELNKTKTSYNINSNNNYKNDPSESINFEIELNNEFKNISNCNTITDIKDISLSNPEFFKKCFLEIYKIFLDFPFLIVITLGKMYYFKNIDLLVEFCIILKIGEYILKIFYDLTISMLKTLEKQTLLCYTEFISKLMSRLEEDFKKNIKFDKNQTKKPKNNLKLQNVNLEENNLKLQNVNQNINLEENNLKLQNVNQNINFEENNLKLQKYFKDLKNINLEFKKNPNIFVNTVLETDCDLTDKIYILIIFLRNYNYKLDYKLFVLVNELVNYCEDVDLRDSGSDVSNENITNKSCSDMVDVRDFSLFEFLYDNKVGYTSSVIEKHISNSDICGTPIQFDYFFYKIIKNCLFLVVDEEISIDCVDLSGGGLLGFSICLLGFLAKHEELFLHIQNSVFWHDFYNLFDENTKENVFSMNLTTKFLEISSLDCSRQLRCIEITNFFIKKLNISQIRIFIVDCFNLPNLFRNSNREIVVMMYNLRHVESMEFFGIEECTTEIFFLKKFKNLKNLSLQFEDNSKERNFDFTLTSHLCDQLKYLKISNIKTFSYQNTVSFKNISHLEVTFNN
ncbi:hypothetical protein CWI38_1465p0020 [Hamiltosporidium tvaerminnensis]|uniref:Uncharacterized protein n=1 Tax=Hamiltosporidium tvaerminnensis TaxID=1176355 RepID=A0A4V2JX95_9MICR|nr:hypothetical protein CWI38_1465p0020 [Hamiltosporidium tvaerminnensis]